MEISLSDIISYLDGKVRPIVEGESIFKGILGGARSRDVVAGGMWSPVTGAEVEPAPAARCKHSATLLQGYVYLLGGKSGNVPLKDFWKYHLAEGKWSQVQATGDRPPCLQEHTAVAWKDQIYVFGGEVGFSGGSETPLWVYSSSRDTWRKVRARRGVQVPRSRRGHTALVHRGAMLVYGGYQDLRGSSADLWAFHFDTESWHLLSAPSIGGEIPPARHRHSAVLHDDSMWIYGGMTDLQARSDLWRWDTRARCWSCIRAHGPQRPGALHGHASAAAHAHMLLIGGEPEQEASIVWRFGFDTEQWERLEIGGGKPGARSEAVALTVSELLLQATTPEPVVHRPRTARNNKVCPADTTTTTYIAGTAPPNSSSFISRLAALRSSSAGCHYTVLHADSTESLLSSTPQRLPKSKSSYHTPSPTPSTIPLSRDPLSVPNFSRLADNTDSTAQLVQLGDSEEEDSGVNGLQGNHGVNGLQGGLGRGGGGHVIQGKLVLLGDSEEEDSGVNGVHSCRGHGRGGGHNGNSNHVIQVKPVQQDKKVVIYENVRGVARGESYSSHLGYAESTSDYASLDMSNSSSSYSQPAASPMSPPVYRTRGGGFCNPNYLEAPRKQVAALLNSAPSEEPRADLDLELQTMGPTQPSRRRVGRASSASRAETRTDARVAPRPLPPRLFVYLVGGKEKPVTVMKKPVAIWKLQLY